MNQKKKKKQTKTVLRRVGFLYRNSYSLGKKLLKRRRQKGRHQLTLGFTLDKTKRIHG